MKLAFQHQSLLVFAVCVLQIVRVFGMLAHCRAVTQAWVSIVRTQGAERLKTVRVAAFGRNERRASSEIRDNETKQYDIDLLNRALLLLVAVQPQHIVSLALLPGLRPCNDNRIRVPNPLLWVRQARNDHLILPVFHIAWHGPIEPPALLTRPRAVALMILPPVYAANLVRDRIRLQAMRAVLGGELDPQSAFGSVEPVDVHRLAATPGDFAAPRVARGIVDVQYLAAWVVVGCLGQSKGEGRGSEGGEDGEEADHFELCVGFGRFEGGGGLMKRSSQIVIREDAEMLNVLTAMIWTMRKYRGLCWRTPWCLRKLQVLDRLLGLGAQIEDGREDEMNAREVDSS